MNCVSYSQPPQQRTACRALLEQVEQRQVDGTKLTQRLRISSATCWSCCFVLLSGISWILICLAALLASFSSVWHLQNLHKQFLFLFNLHKQFLLRFIECIR